MKTNILLLLLFSTIQTVLTSESNASFQESPVDTMVNTIIGTIKAASGYEQYKAVTGQKSTAQAEPFYDKLDEFFDSTEIGTVKAQAFEKIMATEFGSGKTPSTTSTYKMIRERYGLPLLQKRMKYLAANPERYLPDVPEIIEGAYGNEKGKRSPTGKKLYATLLTENGFEANSDPKTILTALNDKVMEHTLATEKSGIERLQKASNRSNDPAEKRRLAELTDKRMNKIVDYIITKLKNGYTSIKNFFSRIFADNTAIKTEILTTVTTAEKTGKTQIITSTVDALNQKDPRIGTDQVKKLPKGTTSTGITTVLINPKERNIKFSDAVKNPLLRQNKNAILTLFSDLSDELVGLTQALEDSIYSTKNILSEEEGRRQMSLRSKIQNTRREFEQYLAKIYESLTGPGGDFYGNEKGANSVLLKTFIEPEDLKIRLINTLTPAANKEIADRSDIGKQLRECQEQASVQKVWSDFLDNKRKTASQTETASDKKPRSTIDDTNKEDATFAEQEENDATVEVKTKPDQTNSTRKTDTKTSTTVTTTQEHVHQKQNNTITTARNNTIEEERKEAAEEEQKAKERKPSSNTTSQEKLSKK